MQAKLISCPSVSAICTSISGYRSAASVHGPSSRRSRAVRPAPPRRRLGGAGGVLHRREQRRLGHQRRPPVVGRRQDIQRRRRSSVHVLQDPHPGRGGRGGVQELQRRQRAALQQRRQHDGAPDGGRRPVLHLRPPDALPRRHEDARARHLASRLHAAGSPRGSRRRRRGPDGEPGSRSRPGRRRLRRRRYPQARPRRVAPAGDSRARAGGVVVVRGCGAVCMRVFVRHIARSE